MQGIKIRQLRGEDNKYVEPGEYLVDAQLTVCVQIRVDKSKMQAQARSAEPQTSQLVQIEKQVAHDVNEVLIEAGMVEG